MPNNNTVLNEEGPASADPAAAGIGIHCTSSTDCHLERFKNKPLKTTSPSKLIRRPEMMEGTKPQLIDAAYFIVNQTNHPCRPTCTVCLKILPLSEQLATNARADNTTGDGADQLLKWVAGTGTDCHKVWLPGNERS